jgi:hypothetical protein
MSMSENEYRARRMRTLAIVLLVVGILALAGGLMYLIVPLDKLPNMPGLGYLPHATGHHDKRAVAGLVVGVGCLAGAVWMFLGFRKLAY